MTTVIHSGISDKGRVSWKNEDSISSSIPELPDVVRRKGFLFIVADGVGGHGAGDIASGEAVKVVVEAYYASPWSPEHALRKAVGKANLHVFDLGIKSNHFNMSTTMSALALVGSKYYISHIGDSRIYRTRRHTEIEQLTQDHSEVAELVRMRILSPDKVRGHPRRNQINRSLGSAAIVRQYTKTGDLREGDFFVMCTDGVWEPVEDSEMSDIVLSLPAEQACQRLIDLSIERQARDNLSAQVIQVTSVAEPEPGGAGASNVWTAIKRTFGING